MVVVSPTAEGLRMGFCSSIRRTTESWIPAFAGMTIKVGRSACEQALAPVATTPVRCWPDAGPGGSGYAILVLTGWPCTTGVAVSPLARRWIGLVSDVHDNMMEHGSGLGQRGRCHPLASAYPICAGRVVRIKIHRIYGLQDWSRLMGKAHDPEDTSIR